jgi:hypothetical protein
VFVFGGSTADGDVNELWAWDGSTWEQLQQPKGPSARRDARLVWDTARKRGVLFGGRAGTRAVDFWELSLVGNGCSSDEECHSDVCTNGVCGGAPLPEVDAGVAGTGGTSSEGTSGSGPDAGYDGEDNGSGGATSGGSAGGESPAAVSEDAGSALPEGQPEAPVVADDATHARIASDARSFYGCAMSVASDERAWRWALALGALVALRCYRRRGARSLGWTRR